MTPYSDPQPWLVSSQPWLVSWQHWLAGLSQRAGVAAAVPRAAGARGSRDRAQLHRHQVCPPGLPL
jgi:hypothetical protein